VNNNSKFKTQIRQPADLRLVEAIALIVKPKRMPHASFLSKI